MYYVVFSCAAEHSESNNLKTVTDMKRDLKFRAWCPKNKEMYYPDGHYEFWIDNNSIGFYPRYEQEAFSSYNTIASESEEEIIVMQYTGLKDLKGKEIYEGDIMNGRNRVLKIVYWCEKRAAFCESEQFKPTPAKHSFAKLYDKFGKIFNKNGILENHYVVGNIYENAEMLNVKPIEKPLCGVGENIT